MLIESIGTISRFFCKKFA